MSDLILFGNENLQRDIFTVSFDGTRNASGQEIQSLKLARGDGESVVQTRLSSKIIQIRGDLIVNVSPDNLSELISKYNQIFVAERPQYLRVMRSYRDIVSTSSVSDWTASDDAINLALNTTNFQIGSSSVGFDIDVSVDADNKATLTYSSSAQVNLSDVANTGNIELWAYIPDVYYVSSVYMRFGNDSSNYYEYSFTSDYQGYPFSYGANRLSAKWSDFTETGSVNDAQIDYCVVVVNYSSSAIDINGCYIDGIHWVDEDQTRNFPSYRIREIDISGEHYDVTTSKFYMEFLNHTGYAVSTHEYSLFSQTGITGNTNTQAITLAGDIPPLIKQTFLINTATGVGDLQVTNLNNNEAVTISPTSVSAGNTILFGASNLLIGSQPTALINGTALNFTGIIPETPIGINRLRLNIQNTANTVLTNERVPTSPDNLVFDDNTKRAAQQFTATATGNVTEVSVWLFTGTNATVTNKVGIYSNSGSTTPNALIGSEVQVTTSFTVFGYEKVTFTGLSSAVVSGTTYWVVLDRVPPPAPAVPTGLPVYWGAGSAYAGGVAKEYSGGAWGSAKSFDASFIITIEPTAAWNVDWSAAYKKLYLS